MGLTSNEILELINSIEILLHQKKGRTFI